MNSPSSNFSCCKPSRPQRAFNIFVKQYRAPDKLELLPEHKNLLDGVEEIHRRASHRHIGAQMPSRRSSIWDVFTNSTRAFKVAAGIYVDFAKFAGEQKILSQKIGDRPSMAEQAAFAEAAALDAQARKALADWAADRKPDAAPPEKLSEEFAAAIAAYKKFIETDGEQHIGRRSGQ